jgi:hypothetical protein
MAWRGAVSYPTAGDKIPARDTRRGRAAYNRFVHVPEMSILTAHPRAGRDHDHQAGRAEQRQADDEEARRDEQQKEASGIRGAVVLRSVMIGLGRPADLVRAEARPLWDNHYRVNVFVGPDAASARVAHSFFVGADGHGKILASSPSVTRAY